MPKIPANAVLLLLAVGCSFDLAHKTACDSQSDCLDGLICQAHTCSTPAQGGASTGVAGAVPVAGDGQAAGAEATNAGSSSGGQGPLAVAGAGGVAGGEGGASAAVSGAGAVAAGSDGGADDAGGAAGCAAFVEPSETAEVAYVLHPHPSASYLRFGEAVAVGEDTLVVGTAKDDAAFVYVKTECGWSLQAELNADDETPGMSFGDAVAIQGDMAIVGAPFAAVTPSAGGESIKAGAVYVFERSDGTWKQTAKLQAHNADASDQFGISVAMDGDTIAIGAPGEDSASRVINSGSDDNSLESDGAAYVFSHAGGEWVEAAYLKREGEGTGGDLNWGLGISVAVSGPHVVVGSPGTDASGIADAGAAYVFNDDAGVWSLEQTLWVRSQLTTTEAHSSFGASVAVSGDTLAVGAPDDGEGTGTPYGTVSLFSYFGKGAGWYRMTRLGDFARSGDFGASLALQPGRLLVGDPLEINGGQGVDAAQSPQISVAVGAAYLFELEPNTRRWERTHYIKASNARQYDQFGRALALDGDMFAVGAPERHSAPDELYSPMDKYKLGPGAAYVFQIVP